MLELQRACDNCNGTGYVVSPTWLAYYQRERAKLEGAAAGLEPDSPKEVWCPVCNHRGMVLTEDGQIVAGLVKRIMYEQEQADAGERADADAARQEQEEQQARRREREIENLRADLRREEWARGELERKLRRER